MAASSLAVLPSFRSFSTSDSSSSSSSSRLIGFAKLPVPRHRSKKPSKSHWIKVLLSSSPNQSVDDVSDADQFLRYNSIADFMRFKRGGSAGGNGTGELQTAVVSYRKKFPWSILKPFFQVDLVSTIHIADKQYFTTLQKELEPYDCVLYEMVASREILENRRNPTVSKRLKSSRSRGFNILGCIQRQMARILTLDFQLDCLDYQAKNWYHADLDYETFKFLQLEKGESFFSFAKDMTIRSTKAIVQSASIPDDLDPLRSKLLWASRVLPMPLVGLLIIGGICADIGSQASEYPEWEALSRLDFGAAMKVFLAKRLTSEFTQATAEIEEKSVIIGERNRAATEALRRAMDEGHNRIAILYGGGHMPDLGRRLREDFDLVPSQVRWITAWSITNRRDSDTNSLPILKKMAEVSGWPLNRYQTLALLIFSSVLALDLFFWEIFFGTTINWASQIAVEFYQFVDNAQIV
ncbi:PREDICTED: uncharacterized protein LOC104811114 [Tarenaya hassleriana]|uniref:uncharacterized protein LOC104811114 n=1 Tax=Tarenaya hassleriana TaxID=28532 RepID=UPI00053C1DE4|nr:PREDICTED: uncharacterized protein LOC104811114 [Tarenaya hassleriana]